MPAPNRDCQTCRLRRIKCDRSVPTCLKCASRSLECPGYTRRIQFVLGSSRKGQRTSILKNDSPKDFNASSTPEARTPLTWGLDSRKHLPFLSYGPEHPILEMPNIARSVSSQWKFQPRDSTVLLHHFTNYVAAQLVWIDDLQNPWRQYICPLALVSPCVLYAILATAAANIYVMLEPHHAGKYHFFDILSEYRQKSLCFLTQHLMLTCSSHRAENDPLGLRSFQEGLSASILLWHLEMHFPSESQWRLHLRAAQALINHYFISFVTPFGHDECFDFLISEFYCISIWPRLTLTVEVDNMQLSPSLITGKNAILGFVQLMHEIILIAQKPQSTREAFDITDFVARASSARLDTLAIQMPQNTISTVASEDFSFIVNAWFYAVLIFGYRAITRLTDSDVQLKSARDGLFQSLFALSSSLSFAQNQPWPVFIAGTECMGDESKQMWVEARLASLIKFVCPLDRQSMLDFLKAWWDQSNSTPNSKASWMVFKRERAKCGKEFIIW